VITRILVNKDGKFFFQHDNKAVDTQFGRVQADDINNAADGAEIQSNTREKLTVLSPSWLDLYKKLERGPQLMTLKDLGFIAAECGIGPESIVAEAGTGTGAAAIYLSRVAKHVFSFDIEDAHLALGKRNAEKLGASNIAFEKRDIYESLPDNQYDLLLLDNPEPWRALPHYATVKIGGFIVSYTPTILQASQFANAVHDHPELLYLKTCELVEREWNAKGRSVRPSSEAIGHTGFLVFARRIG
jgi:tRNA (adenine57-N1/adenine58-N1)-methyltransferase